MTNCPFWSQLLMVVLGAFLGAGFTYWFRKRGGEYSIETQRNIYQQAIDEIRDERSHIQTIADASDPSSIRISNHIYSLTPYQHIKCELERLRDFKSNRWFSKHFLCYHIVSRSASNKCEAGIELIDKKNAAALQKNAKELLPKLDKILSRLERDTSRFALKG